MSNEDKVEMLVDKCDVVGGALGLTDEEVATLILPAVEMMLKILEDKVNEG